MHINQNIRSIFAVIDLNAILYNRRSFARQGAPDEHAAHDFRPDHGFLADARISQMRPALPWRLQSPKFSCLDQFLCLAFAQLTYRESLRDVESCLQTMKKPALSHGHSRPCHPHQLGRRQRNPRLADLFRFRPHSHHRGAAALSPRRYRAEAQGNSLGLRFHYDRLVPVAFSLGQVSPTQGGYQTPYASRSERARSPLLSI